MATFNPELGPANDPNFFKFSEPIRGIQPPSAGTDKSTGLALAAAGDALASGASLAKSTAEKFIADDARSTFEQTRSDFTSDLQTAKAAIIPSPVSTSAGAVAGKSLLPDSSNPDPIPDGVQNTVKGTVDKLDSLKSAFVNGKINDTYYHMQLDKNVTSLRAKYPGFTDFIDQEVSKITGGIPANQVIGDLMQDINHAATSKKDESDKVLDLARTKGIMFDKGDMMYERLKADPTFAPDFMQWYNQENARDTNLAREKGELDLKGAKNQDDIRDQKKGYSNFLDGRIGADANGVITLSGMDKPEKIIDIYNKATNDPKAYTPEQMEEFGMKMKAHGAAMRLQLATLSDQQGWTNKVGADQRDQILNSKMQYYDGLATAVGGGGQAGPTMAAFMMNQTKAITDHSAYNLTNGDLGAAITNFKILSDKFGPGLTATVLIPTFLKEQQNLPDKLKPLLGQNLVEAHAQPNGENNPTTIAGQSTKIANDDRITSAEKAYLYKGMTNTVETLKNKNLPDDDKAGVVRYLFDPANNGVLQNWKMDYKTTSPDGRLQVVHPGKYAIWTQMTDKDVSDNIAKLDGKSQAYYRSWVDVTGRELIGTDIKNLNHFTGHDDVKFEWHNENDTPFLKPIFPEGPVGQRTNVPQYGIPTGTATPQRQPLDTSYQYQIQQTVDRINSALPNLEHVYKTFGGGNTEAMLLQTLGQYGLDFNGKITGLPKAFGDAVAASRKQPKPEKE